MINNYISSIFIFLILIPEILNSTIEEFRNSLKEVAYSYYMRGKSIQWCVARDHFFSPEEATEQSANYLVTSSFTTTVYQELLNVVVPYSPSSLLQYANDYNDKTEVAGNTYMISDDIMEMRFYISADETKVIQNPSLNQIFPFLQVGDILVNPSYTALVYDFEKDKNGNITDVIIMQSITGYHNNSYIKTKLPIVYASNSLYYYPSAYFYFNDKLNSDFEEGTIKMGKLSKQGAWANINTKYRSSQYAILRFVQGDSENNAVLKYESIYDYYKANYTYNSKINLSDNSIDRSKKFSHLYIAKTVDEMNNAVVEVGDILNYRITIRNSGDKDYNDDIIVTEIISQYVEYQEHSENRKIISFQKDSQNNKLIWNIGKLHKGDEFIITYKVKVIKGKTNDVIVSTGFVGNIRSSTVKNFVGKNLKGGQKNLIKNNYENLKNSYNGKNLINEIYNQSFGIDIKLDKFNITNLILDTNRESRDKTISLNTKDDYYMEVLSNYWSSLATMKHKYPGEEEEVNVFFLKEFEYFYDIQTNHKRREDYIYPQHFKTGDILIYKNSNDSTYSYDAKANKYIKWNITYEDGEYFYIYIEGKGFVGVNYGNDGRPDTEDDRNDFNAKYYKDNNLELLNNVENPSEETLELANLQTLLLKDYYVILRPSLLYNFPYIPEEESKSNGLMIFLIILSIIILAIVIFFVWKICSMKKKGIPFNLPNLKQELLPK